MPIAIDRAEELHGKRGSASGRSNPSCSSSAAYFDEPLPRGLGVEKGKVDGHGVDSGARGSFGEACEEGGELSCWAGGKRWIGLGGGEFGRGGGGGVSSVIRRIRG